NDIKTILRDSADNANYENLHPNFIIIEYYNSGKNIEISEEEYWEKDSSHGSGAGTGLGTASIKKTIKEFHSGNVFLDNIEEGHRVYLIMPLVMSVSVEE
ncbi:hypothetical protein OAT31_02405, partial [Candidatus Marinimicrobia bacterium]|nr:hypothetical protein [Candidatus Neomarinimicrobiota bacterium]